MVSLIIGGSGSGKSEYAERLLEQVTGVRYKYYLATMQILDEDGRNRVRRHRELRRDKGFFTIECPTDITKVTRMSEMKESAVLLECMSNLAANEMFADKVRPAGEVADKILEDVRRLGEQTGHLVIVTNNVFEDGVSYDGDTAAYLRALAEINRRLAQYADEVVEVVAGLPVRWKGDQK